MLKYTLLIMLPAVKVAMKAAMMCSADKRMSTPSRTLTIFICARDQLTIGDVDLYIGDSSPVNPAMRHLRERVPIRTRMESDPDADDSIARNPIQCYPAYPLLSIHWYSNCG